jgi:glycosyltransferase involved in cell wall biosynthesis
MTKKIAIIGTVGLPSSYGGFETLTEYLTKGLGAHFDITVFCSSGSYKTKLKMHNNAKLIYLPINANGIQSILYDIVSIFYALLFADTLLILGVSGCIVLPLVKLISKKKIIVNIDGLEWKRAKWVKVAKWFLKFSEKIAVKFADEIIGDNKVIQDYVFSEYGKKATLIAYGADHTFKEIFSMSVLNNFPFLSQKYAFKVCRIEPENNVNLILEAFSEYPLLNFVLVGNWNNSAYGKQLKLQFDSFENIYLLDPIYNQNILNQLRSNCYLYIHGHSAGGTNPSLVEAMHLELPILAYDVQYNRETTHQKALYFNDSKTLTSLLKSVQDHNLIKTSKALKAIADDFYCWDIIIKQYASLF